MDEAHSKIVDAYQIASRGNFDHARLILEETLYDHPKNVEGWLLMADLAETAEDARQCYQMVLEVAPNNWVAQQRMKILFGQQESQEDMAFSTGDLFPAEEEEEEQPAPAKPELVAPDILDELMSYDEPPTLKESYKAHKKLILGVGAALIILIGLGVISWIASVGFIVWKTGFLAWFG